MMELEEFVSCLKKGTPIRVGSCLEAYKTMLLIEKIYKADGQWKRGAAIGGRDYENSSLG